MMFFAMAAPDEYIADIIDLACKGLGCDETCLLEVFVTHTQAQLQAGKEKWEGRTDKSLIEYLTGELDGWIGNGYKHLRRLLTLLYMGDRVETDEVEGHGVPQRLPPVRACHLAHFHCAARAGGRGACGAAGGYPNGGV